MAVGDAAESKQKEPDEDDDSDPEHKNGNRAVGAPIRLAPKHEQDADDRSDLDHVTQDRSAYRANEQQRKCTERAESQHLIGLTRG